MKKELRILLNEPLLLIGLPVSLVSLSLIIIIRPIIKIRIGFLHSDRIGHFAANTEFYLCERESNKGQKKTLDLFYFPREPCNYQLAKMWKRKLHILPYILMRPLCLIIRKFKWLTTFKVPYAGSSDINNNLDNMQTHLSFTEKEDKIGQSNLQKMGISIGSSFVCLFVRDSAYLAHRNKDAFNYHNYRNTDIQNYALVASELADLGYYVIRMGAKVNEGLKVNHPKVIDYAWNGMRSDFMDIYLSAKCDFAISTGTGICEVSRIFRRPMVYVNIAPTLGIQTSRHEFIILYKKHERIKDGKELTQKEIFESGAGDVFTTEGFESKGVKLIDNTPEEIRDVSIQMVEFLKGIWKPFKIDDNLQKKFRKNLSHWATEKSPAYYGELRAQYSTHFLRNNSWWVE